MTKTSVIVTCPRCGFERTITHEELISGSWQGKCPVCQPPDDDDARRVPA